MCLSISAKECHNLGAASKYFVASKECTPVSKTLFYIQASLKNMCEGFLSEYSIWFASITSAVLPYLSDYKARLINPVSHF